MIEGLPCCFISGNCGFVLCIKIAYCDELWMFDRQIHSSRLTVDDSLTVCESIGEVNLRLHFESSMKTVDFELV